jgi:hypothetical protein
MSQLRYKLIANGDADGKMPLNVAFVDTKDIAVCGLSLEQAAGAVAKSLDEPTAINIFDMDAVTTTSDGIMVDSAIVAMAASDKGKIHREYGYVPMAEIRYEAELIALEPLLKQWNANYLGRRLFRGPDVADKKIPVHNVAVSGRACNNNSGTEMMNLVTMEEILMPYIGQREVMTGGDLAIGMTGEIISVGIGMTVMEKFGRVFSTRRYRAGDTAHGSKEYAKTLKANIPCIVADKRIHAHYTIKALQAGLVPGRDIGCSPAVLAIARATGFPIDYGNITDSARAELDSVGFTAEWLTQKTEVLTADEALERADELVPGVVGMQKRKASELVKTRHAEI